MRKFWLALGLAAVATTSVLAQSGPLTAQVARLLTRINTWTAANTFRSNVDIGVTGVRLTDDADGALTLTGLGNGSDENLIINLDDIANTVTFSSSTGVVTVNFAGMAVQEDGVGLVSLAEIDTSAEIAAIVTDETGTGALTFATDPVFTTSISMGAAGVKFSDDGDGAITLLGLGNGSDENLILNLDDVANTAGLSSSTGVTTAYWTEIGQTILKAAIGVTSTDAIVLTNTTAAAAGAQQWSPRVHWIGQGWKTDAVAASQTVDWIVELVPVQGAANPQARLDFNYQVNGGGYQATPTLSLLNGNVGIGSTSPEALLEVQGAEATDAVIALDADDGDDDADTWFLKSLAADNSFSILNHTTEVLNLTSAGALQIDDDLTVSGSDVTIGVAGVKLTGDGDGAITFLGLGNGFDEDLTLNLDDTDNTGVFTSSTGLITLNFSAIALQESGINVLNNDEIDASSELLAIMDDETGSGLLVFNDTPTFVTPVLGVATGTSLATSAQNIFTAVAGTAPLILRSATAADDDISLLPKTGGAGRFAGILTTDDLTVADKTYTFPNATGNVALDTGGATSGNVLLETEIDASAELLALMDDETGSGLLVFNDTPTLIAPAIGAATGTSLVLTGNLTAEDLLIEDSDASHYLTITTTSNLTAGHTLTLVPGDADRSVTLSGDLTVESASLINQDLTSDAAVTFATLDTGQGANELYDMDQNVLTTSSPTFANLTDSGLTATRVTFAGVSGLLSDSANLTWSSPALTIGVAGAATGQLKLAGATSGTITVSPAAVAGTWSLVLPANDGDAGQQLQTDGNGNATWAAASAAVAPTILTKSATYTVLTADGINQVILCTSGTFTVTLYATSGQSGSIITVKNAGTGVVTVDGNAAETIDGTATRVLSTQYESVTLVTDGTNWYII